MFDPAFKNALVDHHAENGQFVDQVFDDDRLMHALSGLMLDRLYGRLRGAEGTVAAGDDAG